MEGAIQTQPAYPVQNQFGDAASQLIKGRGSLFPRLKDDDASTIVVEWGACVKPAGEFWRELFNI